MNVTAEERVLIDQMINYLIDNNIIAYMDHTSKNEVFRKSHPYNDWVDQILQSPLITSYDSGCTKAVFFSRKIKNWVLKVPFIFENDIDYCQKEYENYCLAESLHLDGFFAEVQEYDTINGFTFYIQRKAICSEENFSSDFYNYLDCDDDFGETEEEKISRINSYMEDMEDYERVAAVFGDNHDDLINFINEESINDLHEGNFGFIDGEPVIIDYSGF